MRLTAKQAADRARVSVSLIYQWCAERRLRHLRVGARGRRGKILIEEEDLEAFLLACEVAESDLLDDTDLKHIR